MNNDIKPKIEAFKQRSKFEESTIYPGASKPELRSILEKLVNQSADDFAAVALKEPTDEKYNEQIGIGLKRFNSIYEQLDTEDREQVCRYFEELMDIVQLQSSEGQLNEWIYGFDLTKK